MIYWRLFCEFFQIGLFAVGGGMATIPFLEHLSEKTGWYPLSFISDMIAISESTPGPIGINMATYVGYNVGGPLGGMVATFGEVLPSILIVILVSKFLEEFRGNHLVNDAFYGLRPAVTSLILVAGLTVIRTSFLHYNMIVHLSDFTQVIEWGKFLVFLAFFLAIRKWNKHPIFYIASAAVVGIALQL
jgi:chromate transporter